MFVLVHTTPVLIAPNYSGGDISPGKGNLVRKQLVESYARYTKGGTYCGEEELTTTGLLGHILYFYYSTSNSGAHPVSKDMSTVLHKNSLGVLLTTKQAAGVTPL